MKPYLRNSDSVDAEVGVLLSLLRGTAERAFPRAEILNPEGLGSLIDGVHMAYEEDDLDFIEDDFDDDYDEEDLDDLEVITDLQEADDYEELDDEDY